MNFRSPNKIESKYGVVSDYTNLNLHQAAFTNDVGSAAFALRNGQPQNSVYKGTLPIHAASLAGSRDVLRMLIDAGADVNAPRLPKHVGAPKESHLHHHHEHNPPGTTGSTALHFAAAGGHLQIINILLDNGADPNKVDKNGQVPATLA
ncbi:ankyrin, partial [Wallemia mellicola CBS 633.66]